MVCEASAVFVCNTVHGGEQLLTYVCGSEDRQDSKCIFLHVYVSGWHSMFQTRFSVSPGNPVTFNRDGSMVRAVMGKDNVGFSSLNSWNYFPNNCGDCRLQML